MIRLLFIHSSSELYGSDRSLLNIVKNLDRTKFAIYIILPSEGSLLNELKKIDDVHTYIYNIAVLRRKNLSFKGGIQYFCDFIKSYKFLKRFIQKHHIDIVDTNTSVVFPGAIAAKKTKAKSVWHIREIITNQFENRVISFLMNRYSDLIVANSASTGKALKVDQRKIRVVYNAVDTRDDDSISSLNHDPLTVGMAGRINRWKGQKFFVDVAELVKKDFPDVQFIIAGDAYEGEKYLEEDLKEYIYSKNLGNTVHMLGQVQDMEDFYKSLDVFLLPSIQPEPFGLVVIEAMEASVPVIATRQGGPTEIITDGENGYLADYIEPTEMADKLKLLLSDYELRGKIGATGREHKRKLFSIDAMINKLENVYFEVMKL